MAVYDSIFSEAEALGFFMDTLKKINTRLPKLFGPEVLQPEIYDVDVKPVPPTDTGLAYYRFVFSTGPIRTLISVYMCFTSHSQRWSGYDFFSNSNSPTGN